MQYPRTLVRAVTENIYDHQITDPYRWLENGGSKSVQKWTDEQNTLTNSVIKPSLVNKFARELKRHYHFPSIGMLYKTGPYYFNWERQPDQQQSVLYIRIGLKGEKRALIDLNKLSKKKTADISYWAQSYSGKYMVYGLDLEGEEKAQMRLMETETGKDVEIIASNASDSSISWLPDDSGFFYTKNPDRGTVSVGDERYFEKLYFHQLGTDSKNDELIFGENRPKEDILRLALSEDGEWLSISAAQNWVQNDIYLYNTKTKKLRPLIVGVKASSGLSFARGKAFLFTDYKAPNERLLTASQDAMHGNIDEWDEFLPESKHRITGFSQTLDFMLITYMSDAKERTYIYNYEGKRLSELPAPPQASISGVSSSREESEFFFEYVSHTTPGVRLRYMPRQKKFKKYYESPSLINSDDFVVKQEWFVSRDGTKVPMFIVHHNKVKLTGSNPTILYGYGGFDSSETPVFLRSYLPWLERGGVFAVANIRGGGEFGKKWHTAAMLKNKQRSYDDFIAATEHLLTRKYTDPNHLGISGGSNGGLLVSAVAMQRPELFRAVKAAVPLTDMVRFPLTHIASRWTSEYGDPAKAKDLAYILKYSPYHNVKSGTRYPAFLFTTGANDTRVDPLHARKMTALLQVSTSSDHPILIHTDKGTGHTGSLTMDSFYQNSGRSLAFFAQELGLKI